MMIKYHQLLLMAVAALFAIINAAPAAAQVDSCYGLPGKAADYVFTPGGISTITNRPTWYVTRAPGSTVAQPSTARIGSQCFFFQHEPYDMRDGKPVLRSAPTSGGTAPVAEPAKRVTIEYASGRREVVE